MKSFTAVAGIVGVGILVAFAGFAAAQPAYPNKPIRVITPFPPGGTTTILARLVGQKLTERWGQVVIVDNRPGGNTIIGTEALTKAPADGYTLLLTTNVHVIIPNLQPTPYDVIRDFAAVTTLANSETLIVVHPSVAASNLQALIALAKANPGQLNYASGGSGGPSHLAGEFFNILAGVKTQHVPYKGSAQSLLGVVGGQVQIYYSPAIVAIPHVKGGRVRAIAISGNARLSALPDVPTVTEAGLDGFDVGLWYGVLAPARTPKAIIEMTAAAIGTSLATANVRETLSNQGLDPLVSTPAQFTELMKSDLAKFARVIRTANIKLEQ